MYYFIDLNLANSGSMIQVLVSKILVCTSCEHIVSHLCHLDQNFTHTHTQNEKKNENEQPSLGTLLIY